MEDLRAFLSANPGPLGIACFLLDQDEPLAWWPMVWWVLVTIYPNDLPTFDRWHDILWDLARNPSRLPAGMRQEVIRTRQRLVGYN